ncbi:hypothetical protein EDD18DRAFT_352300 [Armillaria luteobubalina]|uniref:Secreted protein n=1 Tax=Armillaria luteobubalina TaxID=153913 RepID=A0AA39Q4G7_9AGAR|nr:hypothetical protein EDD18DRAFT_352300 [Armillaria luteobubalina]
MRSLWPGLISLVIVQSTLISLPWTLIHGCFPRTVTQDSPPPTSLRKRVVCSFRAYLNIPIPAHRNMPYDGVVGHPQRCMICVVFAVAPTMFLFSLQSAPVC